MEPVALASLVEPGGLSFVHSVFVLPDAEPLHQVLGALQFRMKAVLLTFEPGNVLHGHKDHLLLAERVFGFDLQLLNVLVTNLRSFPGAATLVGFSGEEEEGHQEDQEQG